MTDHSFIFAGTKRLTINLDLTRHPTLLVKVDNAAVSLAPGAQVHSSSLSDVGLTGVGFRSTDQNADTRQEKRKENRTYCGEKLSVVEVSGNICLNNYN